MANKRASAEPKKVPKPWYKRLRTWIAATVTAGLAAGTIAVVQREAENVVTDVVEAFTGPAKIEFTTSSGPLVHIDIEQGMGCNLPGWVFPADSPALTSPPGHGPTQGGMTWDSAPGAFGGVIGSGASLYLSLTGPEDHAVLISDLVFKVYARKPPLEGKVVNSVPSGCGNGATYRYGAVDLDSKAPYYQKIPKSLPEGFEPLRFPYKVTADSPEVFLLDIFTRDCWCSWSATLRWVDGKDSGEVNIDNHGRPFEMTPTRGLPAYEWVAEWSENGETPTGSKLLRREIGHDGPIWER